MIFNGFVFNRRGFLPPYEVFHSRIKKEDHHEIRAEVVMDSAADLPSADSFEGYRLSAGSIAWAVNSSTIYAMNSAGEWIEQNGGE